jgi:uncharacterized protein YndB with AHSA1/START domain
MIDLATYLVVGGRPAVRFTRTYPHPRSRVWEAVTRPEELGQWFPSTVEIELTVGGQVRFSGDPSMENSTGTVLTCDPPARLSFTWGDSELHFELAEDAPGSCRFTLTNVLGLRNEAARNAAGWAVCLFELDKVVAGTPTAGPHSEDTLPWAPLYEAHIAAGLPSGAPVPT